MSLDAVTPLHRQMNALKVFTAFKEGKPPAIKINVIIETIFTEISIPQLPQTDNNLPIITIP